MRSRWPPPPFLKIVISSSLLRPWWLCRLRSEKSASTSSSLITPLAKGNHQFAYLVQGGCARIDEQAATAQAFVIGLAHGRRVGANQVKVNAWI